MSTNKKITELTAISTGQIANDDVFPIVDVSESTTKKASILSLIETISGVTSLTAQSPIAADASTGDVTLSLNTVPVTKGGTNATTAADARTNLGVTATGADTTYAYRANNLSDLANASTARTNLGVTATGSDTTYAYRANNLSDLVSASTARTNLGLGSIATQDASSVAITGGSITGITDLAVADGGTGASTAATARTNLGAAASGANSDITSLTGLTTALSVAQGGTGSTALTANNVILGNGTSAVQAVAPGTSGNVLTSNGTTWTSSSLPASTDVTSFSAGTTGFTPSTATSGAVTLAGTLSATNGGTGQSSYTTGDILYASTSSALSQLADVATGNALISGGVGTAPAYGKIGLTTHVSGTLAATNGGTDQSSYAVGDILYASTTTGLSKLADVATGNALISGGVGVAPSYGKIGLTTHVSGTLALGNGGTGATTAATAATALGVGTGDSPTHAGLNIDTASGVDGQWNTSGLTVYANGVTPQHDGPLHVMSGSAGAVTASASYDELIVEGSGSAGITVFSPDANTSAVGLGSPSSNVGAEINWNYSTSTMVVGTNKASTGKIGFNVADYSQRGEWNTTGLTCFASGVTPQHDGVLHVMSGSAGTVTASTDSDELTVEAGGAGGISILTPSANYGIISFGSPTNNQQAKVYWNDSGSLMQVGTLKAGASLTFVSGGNSTALTLNSSQQMVALTTYSTTVGATNRDLYIDNTGLIGYVSSLQAAKTDIQQITDTSWLHNLNPVSFKYRKKDEAGHYTDEIDGDIQYGMVAEEVEAVRPDLCFYDDVADLDANGEKTETTHKELRGIQYSKLVPVLLKEVQKLRAELNQMKAN